METRPIPGEPGYFAREDGAIFSNRQGGRMKQLSSSLVRGYLSVSLMREGKTVGTRAYVHVLVCSAFHGPRPAPGVQVRHLNNEKLNCAEGNLAWGTPAEQYADRVAAGTDNAGGRNGRRRELRLADGPVVPLGDPVPVVRAPKRGAPRRLSDADIARMRRLEADGVDQVKLGQMFKVHPGYVSQICRGAVRPDATGQSRANRNTKVTAAQVAEMWLKKAQGRTVVSLAAEYGLSREHAGRLTR